MAVIRMFAVMVSSLLPAIPRNELLAASPDVDDAHIEAKPVLLQ
jgi:hypothetical protein